MRRKEEKRKVEKKGKGRRRKESTKIKRILRNRKEQKRSEQEKPEEIGEKRSYTNILIWNLGDGQMKRFTSLIPKQSP